MSLLEKIMGGPKESPEDKAARETEASIIKRYGLRKDPAVPNKYIVDQDHYIMFNPRDKVSAANAMKTLDAMIQAPVIRELTQEDKQQLKKTPPKKPAAFEIPDIKVDKRLFNAGDGIDLDYEALDPFRKRK